MRTITTHVTVYTYEELSDEAKQAAVRAVSEKLTGPWWDSADTETLTEAIVYGFAGELRSPGWDHYGQGDFPGIDSVKLVEWDLDRGQTITFKGYLTRDNAPALPWADGIESVTLAHPDYSRTVEVDTDTDTDAEPAPGQVDAMRDAARSAIDAAWKAGRTELDYLGSDENALGWIEANEPEFTDDGSLYH